jgi:hypothetical protein
VSLPAPVRGLVVRHAFLWSHEKAAGRDEGSKERPAVIVIVAGPDDSGDVRVSVVPITHSPPEDPDGGLELPDEVKRQLGFDPERQWVIFDEVNRFVWPGYDLHKVPRTGADSYGMVPEPLFRRVVEGVLARHRAKRGTVISRD